MQYETKNDITVQPPATMKVDKRPARGAKLFAEPYANIFICAKKKSGKTVTIYNILKHCLGPKTVVVFFVSTLLKDATYQSIIDMLDVSKIKHIDYTAIKTGKTNHLDAFMATLGSTEQKGEAVVKKDHIYVGGKAPEVDKTPKSKFQDVEYLLVFDDLGEQLRNESLTGLLKKNRHYKMKVIVSSQYWLDICPAARKQLDYAMIFKNINERQLNEIRKDVNVAMEPEEFNKIYDEVTEGDYNFLYIDTINDELRKNFNEVVVRD